MNHVLDQLYDELHLIKKELLQKKSERIDKKDIISYYIEAELSDIKSAIEKMNQGSFGQCEYSGEQLPLDWITTIPTLKTKEDIKVIQSFFKIPMDKE